ncbi:GNAT family N-acetyltransferase [Marivita geojedonensis]|uniref:GNAT family N-acetyltransferase n=1 Tax=Marivita geojedonensis TaxID=1123756 RepID=UPI002FCE181E
MLSLIRTSFAYMDGRIDPPSSMHRLTPQALATQAETGEIWVIGQRALACVFLTPKADCLYLGKLAVAAEARGQGLAHRLVQLAEERARALHLPRIEVQTRVELTENHLAFTAMGFREIGRTTHDGYTRPTSITFSKAVQDQIPSAPRIAGSAAAATMPTTAATANRSQNRSSRGAKAPRLPHTRA